MLHALGLEAPLIPLGFKDFDSLFFFFDDSNLLILHALRLEAPLIPSGLEDFDNFSFFFLNLWS